MPLRNEISKWWDFRVFSDKDVKTSVLENNTEASKHIKMLIQYVTLRTPPSNSYISSFVRVTFWWETLYTLMTMPWGFYMNIYTYFVENLNLTKVILVALLVNKRNSHHILAMASKWIVSVKSVSVCNYSLGQYFIPISCSNSWNCLSVLQMRWRNVKEPYRSSGPQMKRRLSTNIFPNILKEIDCQRKENA